MQHLFVYDGSFEGLLTAIFEVYEYKLSNVWIRRAVHADPSLLGENRVVITDKEKARRVLKKLEQTISTFGIKGLFKTFLSELPAAEDHLLQYVRYVLSSRLPVENNFSHPDVLFLQQTGHKVDREKHRMEAFVRFQLTRDGLYYSTIQPDYNVLPLISKHFEERYADQRWLIYDLRRKYGLYYDLNEVTEVQLEFSADLHSTESLASIHDEKEDLYQQLWQQYFNSVNIAARKNMRLHIKHMPRRYWRYLVEKKQGRT
jgi:probable DNA metabolism protein